MATCCQMLRYASHTVRIHFGWGEGSTRISTALWLFDYAWRFGYTTIEYERSAWEGDDLLLGE